MSDKEWYEGLSMGELPGKHVHVVLSNATMDGCLNLHGEIPYWAEDDDLKYVQVLERGHDQVWRTAVGVESVSLVWDERDWEQIRTEDISKADAIVVNGRLLQVGGLCGPGRFLPSKGFSVPFEHVSCALRRRSKLPTEPGTYRGADGTLLIRFNSVLAEGRWMYASRDFLESGAYVDDEMVKKYLPLTPVHFVDGRAGQ